MGDILIIERVDMYDTALIYNMPYCKMTFLCCELVTYDMQGITLYDHRSIYFQAISQKI